MAKQKDSSIETEKKTVKKVQKRINKKESKQKIKKDTTEEQHFILITGEKIKNVKELADCLENLDHHNFCHHANYERNDFANWVSDIFEEYDLAEKIKTARDKEHARIIIYKHICNQLW